MKILEILDFVMEPIFSLDFESYTLTLRTIGFIKNIVERKNTKILQEVFVVIKQCLYLILPIWMQGLM